jgi:hypothetical protein
MRCIVKLWELGVGRLSQVFPMETSIYIEQDSSLVEAAEHHVVNVRPTAAPPAKCRDGVNVAY